MRRSLSISLLAIVGAAIIALALTFTSGNSPRLGLDLQGGASVVLTPKTSASSGALNQAQNIISQRVNGLGVAGATIERQGSNIVVELPGVKNANNAINLVGQTAQLEFRPVVLDSNGQEEIFAGPGPAPSVTPATTPPTTTSPTAPPASSAPPSTVAPAGPSTTKGALGHQARVQAAAVATAVPAQTATSGTSGLTPVPATSGTSGLTPVPGASGVSGISGASGLSGATPPTPTPASSNGPALTPQSVLDKPDAANQTIIVPQCAGTTTACTGNNISARYVLGPVLCDAPSQAACTPTSDRLTGRIVSSAQASIDTTGQWTVNVTFTSKGGSQWDSVVGKQFYQKYVAIVLDNKVISAPQINAQQFNGQATISGGGSGGFNHSQASNLALVLRYGALPVQLTQSDVRTISASLGKASLRAGLIAGFIGLGLVLLYMIFYYRALGLVVVVGLGMSGAFLYALFTWLGNSGLHQSLSLASVVGVIVSIGVTADSYIVYFERLKDDIRAGKSVRSSVDKSFARAWRTIWTADLVSIIAAALLFWLTIGDVRGFAFSLGLSTCLDLITAYLFTRPLVYLLGRNRTFTEARFLGIARGLAATPAGGAA